MRDAAFKLYLQLAIRSTLQIVAVIALKGTTRHPTSLGSVILSQRHPGSTVTPVLQLSDAAPPSMQMTVTLHNVGMLLLTANVSVMYLMKVPLAYHVGTDGSEILPGMSCLPSVGKKIMWLHGTCVRSPPNTYGARARKCPKRTLVCEFRVCVCIYVYLNCTFVCMCVFVPQSELDLRGSYFV